MPSGRTRGNGHKLKETQQVPSEHQETLFYCDVDEHWHRLPTEVMESQSLGTFGRHLDMVLGNWPEAALLEERCWTR